MKTVKTIFGVIVALGAYFVFMSAAAFLFPSWVSDLWFLGVLAILGIGFLRLRNPGNGKSFKTGSLKDIPKDRVQEIRRISKNWESWMRAAKLAHENRGTDGKVVYSYPIVRAVRNTHKGIELDIYPLIGDPVAPLIAASERLAPAMGRHIEARQDENSPTHATWLVVMFDPLAGIRTFAQGEESL